MGGLSGNKIFSSMICTFVVCVCVCVYVCVCVCGGGGGGVKVIAMARVSSPFLMLMSKP